MLWFFFKKSLFTYVSLSPHWPLLALTWLPRPSVSTPILSYLDPSCIFGAGPVIISANFHIAWIFLILLLYFPFGFIFWHYCICCPFWFHIIGTFAKHALKVLCKLLMQMLNRQGYMKSDNCLQIIII